jgi:hypothetical protein
MEYIKQVLPGGLIALGIAGQPAEVESELMALENWNCIGPKRAVAWLDRRDYVHRWSPRFAYVTTSQERLEHGLMARLANRHQDEELARYKGKPGGIKPILERELQETLASIKSEVFLRPAELESAGLDV